MYGYLVNICKEQKMFKNIITYTLISIAREKLCGKVLLRFKKVKQGIE